MLQIIAAFCHYGRAPNQHRIKKKKKKKKLRKKKALTPKKYTKHAISLRHTLNAG